jgi:hypothetical protein
MPYMIWACYSTHNRETAVVREVGETPNDRNDRGITIFVTQSYHVLIQSSSHPRWNRMVQHAHISNAPTNQRAGPAKTTDDSTSD